MIDCKCFVTHAALVKCTICSNSNDCVVHVLHALDAFGVEAWQIHYHENSWTIEVLRMLVRWSSLRVSTFEFAKYIGLSRYRENKSRDCVSYSWLLLEWYTLSIGLPIGVGRKGEEKRRRMRRCYSNKENPPISVCYVSLMCIFICIWCVHYVYTSAITYVCIYVYICILVYVCICMYVYMYRCIY